MKQGISISIIQSIHNSELVSIQDLHVAGIYSYMVFVNDECQKVMWWWYFLLEWLQIS